METCSSKETNGKIPTTAKEALAYTPLCPLAPTRSNLLSPPRIHTTIPVVLEEYPVETANRAQHIASSINRPDSNPEYVNSLLMHVISSMSSQDMSYLRFKQDGFVLDIDENNAIPQQSAPLDTRLSPSARFLAERTPLHPAVTQIVAPQVSKLSESFLTSEDDSEEEIGHPRNQQPQQQKSIPSDSPASHAHTVASLTPQVFQDIMEKNVAKLLDKIFDADDEAESYDYDYDAIPQKMVWQRPVKQSSLPLNNKSLLELQDTLRRAVGRDFFLKVDLDDLLRLERICARSLSHVGAVDLTVSLQDLHDRDLSILIEAASNSLHASDVLLRIVNSPRKENQLFSEDVLLAVAEDLSLVIEHVLLPVVPKTLQECGPTLSGWRQNLEAILSQATKVLDFFCKSIYLRPLDESSITKVLFLAVKILFMESTPKAGYTLSHAATESLRSVAMEVLAVTYSAFTEQQDFILDEVLTSMQKLPSSKSHARQFRVGNVSIQTVSALLMRLIGSCGGYKFTFDSSTKITADSPTLKQFEGTCNQATANARAAATNTVHYLIDRASKSTKASESPYRAILDLFVEDFINVYGQMDWMSGELILHTFVRVCSDFLSASEKQQTPVTVSTVCMDVLGVIGCHVLSFRRKCHEQYGITRSENEIEDLQQLAMSAHYVLRTLNDIQNQTPFHETVQRYFVSQWGNILSGYFESENKDVVEQAKKKFLRLAVSCSEPATMTKSMIEEDLESSSFSKDSSNDLSRILLHMPLAESYGTILATICHSLEQSRTLIRSKALKSLTTLLNDDPAIMQLPYVARSLKSRLVDASASVRDAAVEIVGKYVLLQPENTTQYFDSLFDRVSDTSMVVRKRVLRLLRDLYTTTGIDLDVKLLIIEKLLYRTEDEEESVQELAASTLSEMWFSTANFEDAKTMMATVKKSEQLGQFLARFLDSVFNPLLHKEPIPEHIFNVGKTYVSMLVKHVVSTEAETEHYLALLGFFVESNVMFISQNHLTSLRGYISADVDDLSTYNVLKTFETAIVSSRMEFSNELLKDIETSMLKKLTKFNVKELSVAVPCLWAVCSKRNDTTKLETAMLSCVKALLPHVVHLRAGKLQTATADPKFKRLVYLVGTLGRYCDFNSCNQLFLKLLGSQVQPSEKTEELVAGLFLLFCDPKMANQEIIRLSVRNLLSVCIGFPQLFMLPTVISTLDMALARDEELQTIVLKQMGAFLENEEQMATKAGLKGAGNTDSSGKVDIGVLHGTTSKFINDGVCASLVQRYLDKILEISLIGKGPRSLSAILLLDKISHQGFANPRLLMTTTIALESSPVSLIASKAQNIHRLFHEKHESLIDGTYFDGVVVATEYLRRLLGPEIAFGGGYLNRFFAVIKGSRSSRRKFFLNMTRMLELDDTTRLWVVIFLCRALSTLELSTVEDAHMIVHSLNSVVSKSEDVHSNPITAVSVQLITCLRRFIKMSFSLTDTRCVMYTPATRGGQIHVKELNKLAIRSPTVPHTGMEFENTFLDFSYQYDDPERNAFICGQVKQMLLTEASDEIRHDLENESVVGITDSSHIEDSSQELAHQEPPLKKLKQ